MSVNGNQPVKVDDLALVSGKLAAFVPLWSGKATTVKVPDYDKYELLVAFANHAGANIPSFSCMLIANEQNYSAQMVNEIDITVNYDGKGNISGQNNTNTSVKPIFFKVYGLGGGHS